MSRPLGTGCYKALVNRDELYEGRLDKVGICDLDRKGKPSSGWMDSRNQALNFLVMRSHPGHTSEGSELY